MFARSALPAAAALAVLLGGVPLSVAGLLCAAGIVYATLALPRLEWRRSRWLALGFLLVVGLRLVGTASAPPIGLRASYFSRPGTAERSTDFSWMQGSTRIDATLDLRGEDFPVHFFNDAARFNFGADIQPGRDQLPFSVRWQGFLSVPSDGERRFVVDSSGPAQVWLDEVQLGEPDVTRFVPSGLRALRVEYLRPEARVPRLRLSWQRSVGGPLEVVGGSDVRWQASGAAADVSRAVAVSADAATVLLTLVWIAFGLRAARSNGLARATLGGVPLLFLVHGMLLQAPLAGRATILSGLDDWLIYESSARDILLNGPLMDGGQGHAAPFYGQPLYPYVLALAHRLTGESLFGPLALQFAALGLVVVGTAVLARRAFGSRLDGLVALACVWGLLQVEAEHFKVARQLFNENLYMPLVMASLIAVVSLARRSEPPTWWKTVLVGALLGLTAISRSQFLLFIPLGLVILLLAWRWQGLPATAAIVAGTILVIAPVTLRNWVVSGQFVPITSSGGASLLEFHRPPSGLVDQAALQKDPLYEALHLDAQTRTVVAFIRADPKGYLATLQPLAAHSTGLQGRNDPGIYWPLLVTTLVYVASFALRQTRRLHVWPIHAFVGTHLLVLMLFEADTYGYRLVMPMYAPMAAVGGQVLLTAVRALTRSRVGALKKMHSGSLERAQRFAHAGWALIAIAALAWQVRSLAEIWPQRDAALHGLGGPAATAAATADRVAADAIYVASIDGTPRRFGAGNLPGLRYPWFKWFDPTRSLPLPPAAATTAVYMLSELEGHTLAGDLVGCLGPPDVGAQLVVDGVEARRRCIGQWMENGGPGVIFEGVARIDGLTTPDTVEAGTPLEARLLWQPLVAHPDPYVVSLQLDDPTAGDARLWGNGTLDLYPAAEWQTGEAVLSRIPVATDATAAPQPYRLTIGMAPARANAAPALGIWQGSPTDRVPVSTVTLTPGSAAALPADMRPVEGLPLVGGGLELIGARPLPEEAGIGGPLRVGLLWRAAHDAPDATQLQLRLVRENGDVVQETQLPLLGGRLLPSVLRAGNVVRDEQTFVIGASVPTESLFLELAVGNAPVRLGSVKMTGRAHQFDTASEARAEATFGDAMQLLSDALEPGEAKASAKLSVKLRWRSAAEMHQAYKVFVHVLDPPGEHVVAQRDAEPLDGRAPTTGWVVGEVIADDYSMTLPATLPAGDYPVEVGVYDARSGDRLRLADGDNRFVLSTRLHVR